MLEGKVQRLTESFLSSQRSGGGDVGREGTDKGNGLWYVLTFAGWMMVPLIVVFMYQFKK